MTTIEKECECQRERKKVKANIEKRLFADSQRNATLKEWQSLYHIKAEHVSVNIDARKSNLFKLFVMIFGTMN